MKTIINTNAMKRYMIVALMVAMLSGCNSGKEEQNMSKEKAIAVGVVKVKKEKIVGDLHYSGTVMPFQTIPLSFETNGTVEKVLVDVGDEVKKGQLLAAIDDTNPQNIYQISLAKYQQAKDAYDRLKLVYDKGSLPEIKWVEMETNLEQARSSLEISKNNIEKCKLYAPANGLIGKRNIEPGMSSIAIGASPLEIVDINRIYVKISIPENEVSRISKGKEAQFRVLALNDKTYTGVVTNISPVADKISRTYEAKILVANVGQELKPGMVCDVKMESIVENGAILIPYQSVSKDDANNTYVYVVDQSKNRVKKQQIVTGQYWGENLEVVSGLAQGQIVIREGKEKLSENTLIIM